MAFPKVSIIFKGVASNAVQRGSKGVVALILKDATAGVHNLGSVAEIPEGLSAPNKKYIQDAFIGGVSAPRKVIVVVIATSATDFNGGLATLATMTFDYLAIPALAALETAAVMAWVKDQRDNKRKKIKAVLPDAAGDHEGIINFATSGIKVGTTTYTSAQYCARIAGILAGTPMNTSATFFTLPEVTDVPALTDAEKDTLIDAGKLIIVNDGRKCKIARAINSLKTVSADKSEQFKKIKIVDIIDLIADDVRFTAEDNYIGRVTNSYDNACILMSAINGYFASLEADNLLAQDQSSCEYDVEAKIAYLKQIGKYVDGMKEIDVKKAPSGDKVFLKASIRPLDVMEDINIVISL